MWSISSVEEVSTAADARWFKWWLTDAEGHELFVVIKIAGSMMSTAIEELPEHAAAAVRTFGRAEVERILDWQVPPRAIEVRRQRDRPLIEVREALPIGA